MNRWKAMVRARETKAAIVNRMGLQRLYTLDEVCKIVSAEMPKSGSLKPDFKFSMICCFDGVFIKGSLYVQYERDPVSFAKIAMNRGAIALLCAEQIEDYPCIIVSDVLTAVQRLCEAMYDEIRIPATVVTGSIGKTSTKNFVNCVYSSQVRTFCNLTNGNTLEYLGFELQRFDRKSKLFIQEVNESDPHNASNCSKALHPHIALITNMDRSHIGELGSEENIMKVISEITDGMGAEDYVVINGDDNNSMRVSFRQRVIRVGIHNREADCVAENICSAAGHVEFDLLYQGERVHVQLQTMGEHNVYNACMAFVAGKLSGITTKNILHGIRSYRPLGFRQNTYRLGKTTIYADCYNSSARSVASAINVMNEWPRKSGLRKMAVIGDIAEIEGFEEETYRSIADTLSTSDIDILFAYGPNSQKILDYLKKSDMTCYHSVEKNEVERKIRLEVKKSHTLIILFKASRSMHLENMIREVFPVVYYKGMLPVWAIYSLWTLKTL